MIHEDGEGGIIEGSQEAQRRQLDTPGGAAPRAGMQGKKDRGAAPTPILKRPGTTPSGTPGNGGGIGKPPEDEAQSGMKDRGGQAGAGVGGSGVHGMQDDANRGPLAHPEEEEEE